MQQERTEEEKRLPLHELQALDLARAQGSKDARIAELEAALRPFADFYTPSMELAGDAHQLTQGSTMARKQITVGDVRRAYKALSN